MAEDAHRGFETYAPDDEDLVEAAPRPRLGVIVAGFVAALASAAMAWWVASPDRARQIGPAAPVAASAPVAQAPEAPLRYAAADPDPNQVKRAWRDVRQTYVDDGPEALVRGSEACARGLPGDPQSLDYCLAYDMYAAIVAPEAQADWFGDSRSRGLALARTALPDGVDAGNRIAQVAALTRAVLPKAAPSRPRVEAVRAVRRPHAKAHAMKARHVRRLVHPAPRVLKASLHGPARVRRRPAARSADAPQVARDADSQAPDAVLNRAQAGGLFDPPH
jgi:hypothetical protein